MTRRRSIIPPAMEEALERTAPSSEARIAAARSRAITGAARAMRLRRTSVVNPNVGEDRELRDANFREPSSIDQAQKVRGEDEPETGDEAVDLSYDHAGQTWECWTRAFDRNGPDGKGSTVVVLVRYSPLLDNAFFTWDIFGRPYYVPGDGHVFNAFWRDRTVSAHELGHWVTAVTCNLGYGNDEDGALNEAGADWMAVTVEQWVLRQLAQEAPFHIGPHLNKGDLNMVALRTMLTPGDAYDDARLGGRDPQWVARDYDAFKRLRNPDPHTGSAVPNLAFAVAAQIRGGYLWEAIAPVWWEVWSKHLRRPGTFSTLAQHTLSVAKERWGVNSLEVSAIEAGWDAAKVPLVGLPPEPPDDDESDCVEEFLAAPEVRSLLKQLTSLPATRRIMRRAILASRRAR